MFLYCIAYCLLYCLMAVSSRALGRPGPGPDRLGLKCYLAWGGTGVVVGGGERGNFMYFKYNFSSVVQKKNLHLLVFLRRPLCQA